MLARQKLLKGDGSMDYIKRINLSFDLRREKDRQVCDILSVIKHRQPM